jgi:hypothetical protein
MIILPPPSAPLPLLSAILLAWPWFSILFHIYPVLPIRSMRIRIILAGSGSEKSLVKTDRILSDLFPSTNGIYSIDLREFFTDMSSDRTKIWSQHQHRWRSGKIYCTRYLPELLNVIQYPGSIWSIKVNNRIQIRVQMVCISNIDFIRKLVTTTNWFFL